MRGMPNCRLLAKLQTFGRYWRKRNHPNFSLYFLILRYTR
jgi:hypothetical protein